MEKGTGDEDATSQISDGRPNGQEGPLAAELNAATGLNAN